MIPQEDILSLFRRHTYFPPRQIHERLEPDDPFILSYVVYHHFRSLGWVVKPGVKFAVDYRCVLPSPLPSSYDTYLLLVLYNRGPVFSHAEFGVLVLPAYSHSYWADDKVRKQGREVKPWHWLHSINRVSSQVKKTVILVYVEIPPPGGGNGDGEEKDVGIGEMLGRYGVREVALRRWLVSRNRD